MRIHIDISMNVRDVSVKATFYVSFIGAFNSIFNFIVRCDDSTESNQIHLLHTRIPSQVRSVANHRLGRNVDVSAAVECHANIRLDDLLAVKRE